MKNDLATSIVAAVVSIIAAYFICDFLTPEIEPVKFNTVDASVSAEIVSPNPEIFNYDALNPTVEVYVGDCTTVNRYGECVDESSEQIEEGLIVVESEETTESESTGTNSTQRNNATDSTTNRGARSGTSN